MNLHRLGIARVALSTTDLDADMASLREMGTEFLSAPATRANGDSVTLRADNARAWLRDVSAGRAAVSGGNTTSAATRRRRSLFYYFFYVSILVRTYDNNIIRLANPIKKYLQNTKKNELLFLPSSPYSSILSFFPSLFLSSKGEER